MLIEYYTDTVFPRIRNMGYQAVRTDRYKYIDYLELAGMDELYDLQSDPYERENLVGTARERELLPVLQAELARLRPPDPVPQKTRRPADPDGGARTAAVRGITFSVSCPACAQPARPRSPG